MRLGLLLALVSSPLAAQSVRSRLEGRVPTAAVPTVDSLVQVAAREDLPTEPLVQKALEGGAKHVSAGRIVAAVQLRLVQMRDARTLLVRAGHGPRSEEHTSELQSHSDLVCRLLLEKKKKNKKKDTRKKLKKKNKKIKKIPKLHTVNLNMQNMCNLHRKTIKSIRLKK